MASHQADSTDRPSPLRPGRRRVAVSGGAAVLALALATTPQALAQSGGAGSLDPASVDPSVSPGSLHGIPSLSIATSTQLGAPVPLGALLGSVAAVGSEDFPRPGSSQAPSEPVSERDDSISSSEVLGVTPLFPGSTNPVDARAEVWTVTSESMQREVRVEVYRAPEGLDAPNVYFLDGVGSDIPSGWSTGMGWGDQALRERGMNVVVPTGAPSSMWSDWVADDPVLGPNNWETFLTEELPPLLELGLPGTADPLGHNGGWGVMGLSMGAASALHLANTYDMFDAVAGVSGAYSTTDELGYQYARLTVDARHGDVTNMWGPRGSQAWRDHDTIADPSGLEGKTVYLSAATGVVGSTELGYFGLDEMVLLDGHILEKGSYESTRRLEAALRDLPGVRLEMNYLPTGIHNWPVFVTEMRPGMDHILSGLPDAVSKARSTTGAAGERGSGSLGSGGAGGPTGSLGSSGSAGG